MTFTFHAPVPAEQIRQLPTRDVALLLLLHLSGTTGYLQIRPLINSAQRAFADEPTWVSWWTGCMTHGPGWSHAPCSLLFTGSLTRSDA